MHLAIGTIGQPVAQMLGRCLESRAGTGPVGACRAAGAVGCSGEYVCARSGARRERREAVTERWLAQRCSGCRFERRPGTLSGAKAARVSMSMPKRRWSRGSFGMGRGCSSEGAALGQTDGEPCGNGACGCQACGEGGGSVLSAHASSEQHAPRCRERVWWCAERLLASFASGALPRRASVCGDCSAVHKPRIGGVRPGDVAAGAGAWKHNCWGGWRGADGAAALAPGCVRCRVQMPHASP